jgi:hypothetical protein
MAAMTTKQAGFVRELKDMRPDARVEASCDEDWEGDIAVVMIEDGLTTVCYVNEAGEINGDWF